MSPRSLLLTPMYLSLLLLQPFPGLSQLTLRHHVGESVKLSCDCRDQEIVMCFWYKQEMGRKPVKVSSFYKLNSKGSFEDTFRVRFALDNLDNANNLTIIDLRVSDAATYFCMSSNLYNMGFLESITLEVKGDGADFGTLVAEVTPEETGAEEGSGTLNCSLGNGVCGGRHGVHWFKPSEESAAGVLYTDGGGNADQCERNTETSTNSCVYDLPGHGEEVASDWSKCAVVSCGRALFGNKPDFISEDQDVPPVLVYVLSGALVATLLLSVLLALSMYKIKKKSQPTATTENEQDIHYAALRHHNSNRPRQLTNDIITECVYSGVRL
uniref:Ig-like domain-containing protein n=1 Tax=Neogobius melanostomus TaxID=47308 RepID=A0A8C6SV96_9GOBI